MENVNIEHKHSDTPQMCVNCRLYDYAFYVKEEKVYCKDCVEILGIIKHTQSDSNDSLSKGCGCS